MFTYLFTYLLTCTESLDENFQPSAVNRRCEGRSGKQRLQDGIGCLKKVLVRQMSPHT